MEYKRILVADDEPLMRDFLVETLERKKYVVESVGSGSQAIEKIKTNNYDLVFTNWKMPNADGIEVLKFTKKYCPETEVIFESVVTVAFDKAMKLGAFACIKTPFTADEVEEVVDRAIENKRNKEKKQELALTKQSAVKYKKNEKEKKCVNHPDKPASSFYHSCIKYFSIKFFAFGRFLRTMMNGRFELPEWLKGLIVIVLKVLIFIMLFCGLPFLAGEFVFPWLIKWVDTNTKFCKFLLIILPIFSFLWSRIPTIKKAIESIFTYKGVKVLRNSLMTGGCIISVLFVPLLVMSARENIFISDKIFGFPFFALMILSPWLTWKYANKAVLLSNSYYYFKKKRYPFWNKFVRREFSNFSKDPLFYEKSIRSGISAGYDGFEYILEVRNDFIKVALYIDQGENCEVENKTIYEYLLKNIEEIELIFGERLTWQQVERGGAYRIGKKINTFDFDHEYYEEETVEALIRLECAVKPMINHFFIYIRDVNNSVQLK